MDEEYIEIFDGEGWERRIKKYKRKADGELRPLLVNLGQSEHTLVYDELADDNFETWVLGHIQVQYHSYCRGWESMYKPKR